MNIYVDKMPGSCKTCDFQCYGECLNGADILNCDYSTMKCHLKKSRPIDCPLKLVSEYKPKKRLTQDELVALKAVVYGCNTNRKCGNGAMFVVFEDVENKNFNIKQEMPFVKALEIMFNMIESEETW